MSLPDCHRQPWDPVMTLSTSLKKLLERPGMLIAPGAYDALGARQIEQAGFEVAYMTGGGTSIARGFPDFGLLDMGEMVANAAAMARSIRIPLIADADTGYGNELNVVRTVREYESRGIAAIHIEDQVSPKRCGHLDGKEVVPQAEFVSKITAAVEARQSTDFLIIARTDARAVLGLDDAIARANAALSAGADMAFVEATQSMEEVAAVPLRVNGPCLLNVVAGGRTPSFDLRTAEAMGYKLTILPALLLMAAVEASDLALAELKRTFVSPEPGVRISDVFRRFGADEWDELRRRFNAGQAMDVVEPLPTTR
jgi:2-methylisocitrate lyase-like PEP mutase family enzyme